MRNQRFYEKKKKTVGHCTNYLISNAMEWMFLSFVRGSYNFSFVCREKWESSKFHIVAAYFQGFKVGLACSGTRFFCYLYTRGLPYHTSECFLMTFECEIS